MSEGANLGNLGDDNLSDTSLIEDEDDETLDQTAAAARRGSRSSSSTTGTEDSSSVIDLPGEPITAPLAEVAEMDTTDGGGTEDPLGNSPGPAFSGWNDRELEELETVARKTGRITFEGQDLPVEEDDAIDIPPSSLTIISSKEQPPRGRGKAKAPTSSPAAASPRLPPKVPKVVPVAATATPPAANRRESREWRPSAMLFKPLAAGWVREVIFKQDDDGALRKGFPPTIVYHAPFTPGTKPRSFKTGTDLQTFLNAADPTLSFHNFSFRQEVMGAPPKQEIIRGEDEEVEIFPKQMQPVAKIEKATNQASKVVKAGTSPGGLKVKVFSKMIERNSQEATGDMTAPPVTSDEIKTSPPSLSPPPTPAPPPSLPPTVSLTPASSSVSATIGPVVPSSSAAHKEKSSVAMPSRLLSTDTSSMTITPVSKDPDSFRKNSGKPRSPWAPSVGPSVSPQQQSSRNGHRIILRPTNPNTVSCSIHCPGVNGFPTLSCCSCHSMFHPICVGLMDGVDYAQKFDFYCIDCQPPPGKENSNPFTHFNPFGASPAALQPGGSATSNRRQSTDRGGAKQVSGASSNNQPGTPTGLPRGLSITPTSKQSAGNLLNGVGKSSPLVSSKMRAIESQSVVNIGGIKYLIVPQPSVKISTPDPNKGWPKRLPILLQPGKDSPGGIPTFEVEETADGKLLLVPSSGPLKKGENPFAKLKDGGVQMAGKNDSVPSSVPPTAASLTPVSSRGACFNTNLSVSYFAMLHVFRFLTLPERLRASRICKLWRDLAYHSSLWNCVSLKNVHVTDWSLFVDFLNRCRASRLDMRKVLLAKGADETWPEVRNSFANLSFLCELQFPRTSCATMASVVTACSPRLESVIAVNLFPKEIDLSGLASARGLKELKLKVAGGKMKAHGASLGSLTTTLTKLSVLGLETVSATDIESVALLSALEHLELGNCSSAPATLFQSVTALTKLRVLRLEGGLVGMDLGALRWLNNLEKLELIDVHLKEGFGDGLIRLQTLKKLLLIPFYTEEVAAVNTEIVDSAMSMFKLTHFFLGLTNEWLETMNSLFDNGATKGQKDSFPILVNGVCEMYSLSKLFKTLSNALPSSKVKILKMSRVATGKQYLDSLIR